MKEKICIIPLVIFFICIYRIYFLLYKYSGGIAVHEKSKFSFECDASLSFKEIPCLYGPLSLLGACSADNPGGNSQPRRSNNNF